MSIRKLALTQALSCLCFSALALADPPEPPDSHKTQNIASCPFVISAPGNYQLGADLTTCAAGGIVIQASHVQLSLNNHLLGSGGSSTSFGTFGILVAAANSAPRLTAIKITGPGVVEYFGIGIELDNVDGAEINGVTSTFNMGESGIQTGVKIPGGTVTGLQLLNNVLVANQNNGMRLFNSSNAQVKGNMFTGNGTAGIVMSSCYDNTIESNVFTGNQSTGLLMRFSSSNRVQNNVLSGNYANGIDVQATGNTFQNNTAIGNSNTILYNGFDLADESSSCGNTWKNNSFNIANLTCIH